MAVSWKSARRRGSSSCAASWGSSALSASSPSGQLSARLRPHGRPRRQGIGMAIAYAAMMTSVPCAKGLTIPRKNALSTEPVSAGTRKPRITVRRRLMLPGALVRTCCHAASRDAQPTRCGTRKCQSGRGSMTSPMGK